MSMTALNAHELHTRLARLYEEGRYRETLREAAPLEGATGTEDATANGELAQAFQFAGCAHRELNELPAAEDRLLIALRLLGSPAGREHLAYARGLEELGYLYELLGHHDQAEGLYRKSLDWHVRNPNRDAEGHARSLHSLSDLYVTLCRRCKAADLLRQAQEIRAKSLGKDHAEYARGLLSEAWMGFRIGRSLSAEEQARKGLQLLRTARGERHPSLASALQSAGRVALAFAHLDEAERLLTQARDICRETLGETHPGFASAVEALSLVKLTRSQPKEAEALARQALEINRAALGAERLETAWSLGTLAEALQAGWKLTEAEECRRQAHEIASGILGERHPAVADIRGDLANTLNLAGRATEAEEVLREAVGQLEKAGPDAAFERVQARLELSRFLSAQGDTEESDRMARLAHDEAAAFAPDDPFALASVSLQVARGCLHAGKPAEADQQIHRAEKLVKGLVPHHSLSIETVCSRMEYELFGNDPRSAIRLGQDCARQVSRGLGETHPAHPQMLRYLAELYHQTGEFEESERLFEQALSLFRRQLGTENPEVAETLRGLARLHLSRNNPAAAETRYRQASDIRRAVLGETHPVYAESLRDLAGLHQKTGNLLGADMQYRQAIDVLRINPGEGHPDFAMALHGRAGVLHAVNEDAEAEKLLEQALEILRADTDNPHPRAHEVRHTLALLCLSRSDFLRAETLLKQTLAGCERVVGRDHEALEPALMDLSRVYEAMGDLVAAGPVLERIRASNLRKHGDASLPHAFDLVNAATLARLEGDFERAESLARRGLGIARSLVPPDHPGLVEFLRPLAMVFQARKEYRESEGLLLEALRLTTAAFGQRHPLVASCQGDLGTLHALSGRHDEASRRFALAADLIRDTQGEDHPEHAGARRVLGLHYQSQKKFGDAERALRKSMEVTRRTAGENHPAVANCLQTLAGLCRVRDDLGGAAELYREALEVIRHTDVPCDALHAALLHGQAVVLLQQDRRQEAEPLLRAALDIDQTAGGSDALGHLDSKISLAHLCAANGNDDEAMQMLRKVLESAQRLTSSFCCLRHDGSPVPYWKQLWDLSEMLLTLAIRSPAAPETVRFLFDLVLRCKGLGPRGMVLADREDMLREHPGDRTPLEKRFVLGRQTASRAAAGAGPEGLETHHRLLGQWQADREALETQLEQRVPALAAQRRWLTADAPAVAAALPVGSVLIDVVPCRLRDFAGLCLGKEVPRPARYLAFALHAGNSTVQMIDLGEAEPMDQLARSARGIFGRQAARAALAERILTPLTAAHGRAEKVVLAVSGPLARVPFPVERQLTSAREVLGLPGAISTQVGGGWLSRLCQSLFG